MFENPWIDRFNLKIDDNDLRQRLQVRAQPLMHLGSLQEDHAKKTLEAALKEVVVPSDQMMEAIKKMLECAKTYSEITFPNHTRFLERVYHTRSTEPFLAPICLTGLAGVGKSKILDAFRRAFFASTEIEIPFHARVPLVTGWNFQISAGIGINQLLAPKFRSNVARNHSRFEQAIQEAATQGVSILIADEMQFQTQGAASTQIAKLLMQLFRIGPPLIYACNYSLLNRLLKRPQEERDRMLTNPIFIDPDHNLSGDWENYIDALIEVAPEFSKLSSKHVAEILLRYSFGIRRSAARLLCAAYSIMRRGKHPFVSLADIEAAYLSTEYRTAKDDVENLIAGEFNPKILRQDLRCPFPRNDKPPASSSSKVAQHPSTESYAKRRMQETIISTLNSQERAAYAELKGEDAESKRPKREMRPKVTVDGLLEGAECFSNRTGKKEPE